jgi:hypothetical protein
MPCRRPLAGCLTGTIFHNGNGSLASRTQAVEAIWHAFRAKN